MAFISGASLAGVANRGEPWLWVDVALGLASLVLVWWRRRWPLTVALLTCAAGSVSALAAGPAVLAAVSVATRRVYWQVLVVGVASVAAGQTYVTVRPGSDTPVLLDLVVNTV